MRVLQFGLGVVAIVSAFAAPLAANAAPIFYSETVADVINATNPWATGANLALDQGSSSASISGSTNFTGLNLAGNPTTSTFQYGSSTSASSGSLKAQVDGTVANPYYNAANAPYIYENTINPDGSPTLVRVRANVSMSDSLNVVGGPGLAFIKANIGIDGKSEASISSSVNAYVFATSTLGSQMVWYDQNYGGTSLVDDAFSTQGLSVSGGVSAIEISLRLELSFYLNEWLFEGYDLFGSGDFFNTLTINSFSGFDANGNPVDLASVTGSDGSSFATVRFADPGDPNQVPEPTSFALIGIGLAGLAAARRQRTH